MMDRLREREGLAANGNGNGTEGDTEPQTDKAAELAKEWGTAVGQCWSLGDHRLVIGDCTDAAVVEAVMRGEKADMAVTDPPYGVTNEPWDRLFTQDDLNGLMAYSTGFVAVFNSAKPEIIKGILLMTPTAERLGVWRYSQITPKPGMIWSWQPVFYWRCQNAVAWDSIDWFQGNSDKDSSHPTQKPVAFFEKIIGSVIAKTVFDPFVGSGTTIIAAHNLGRIARTIELDPGYAAVTLQRFRDHAGTDPRLL
jgi:DNA modification methylase